MFDPTTEIFDQPCLLGLCWPSLPPVKMNRYSSFVFNRKTLSIPNLSLLADLLRQACICPLSLSLSFFPPLSFLLSFPAILQKSQFSLCYVDRNCSAQQVKRKQAKFYGKMSTSQRVQQMKKLSRLSGI